MQERFLNRHTLPDVDLEDYKAKQNRQFAAEYSQLCYLSMLEDENEAVGDYLSRGNSLLLKPD